MKILSHGRIEIHRKIIAMRIEVISSPNEAKKVQGNVLEIFIADWLKVQGYEIDTNVRVTGCELDLLCRNAVSGRTIYVERK